MIGVTAMAGSASLQDGRNPNCESSTNPGTDRQGAQGALLWMLSSPNKAEISQARAEKKKWVNGEQIDVATKFNCTARNVAGLSFFSP